MVTTSTEAGTKYELICCINRTHTPFCESRLLPRSCIYQVVGLEGWGNCVAGATNVLMNHDQTASSGSEAPDG